MDNKKEYTVYMHRFPNEMVYVGLTKQIQSRRWGGRGQCYKQQPIYDEIKKYGWNNIEHIIVAEKLTLKEAQEMERKLIAEYQKDGKSYNIGKGGDLGSCAWCEFEYGGKILTAKELADLSNVDGITYHDITTRINNHGWSVEEAITKPKIEKNQRFEYNGSLYTAHELAEMSSVEGLTYGDVLCRINQHGFSVERAITQPKNVKLQPKGVGTCRFEYNGKIYNSYELSLLSTVEGLTPGDITSRINQFGFTVEEAITTPKKKRNQKFYYNGKYYTSKELADMSNVQGLTYHDITDRVNRGGWSIERAITEPKRKKGK